MAAALTSRKLDEFFKSLLDIEGFRDIDRSLNGLQVDNDGGEINKIAFAVDAALESLQRCALAGAGMLFVHHGLFWGEALPVAGVLRGRLGFLLERNIALYAVHLPLDQDGVLGNNAALAETLGIESPEPFGLYHGKTIGYSGRLKKPLTIDEALKALGAGKAQTYPFGKKVNETCAVISGGGTGEAFQAIDAGVDLYVTGEMSHTVYHPILEGRLNMICCGHYASEVWGVKRVMETCAARLTIDTEFIDVPTGL
ncbi:MAG: Nif3-like dinuclear metal center hexameric protein [Treponema sp.]|jgi:dinuclear metal center YbgI/SA1388 family protein|nr:Nif3-like dinuclear metal center hexameric protein [Treponema sp.]